MEVTVVLLALSPKIRTAGSTAASRTSELGSSKSGFQCLQIFGPKTADLRSSIGALSRSGK